MAIKLKDVIELNNPDSWNGVRFLIKGHIYEIVGYELAAVKPGVFIEQIGSKKAVLVEFDKFVILTEYCDVYQTEAEKVQ